MVVGCGIGCDHGQMWWDDAVMQDAVQSTMLRKMWYDMRDVVERCNYPRCGACEMRCNVTCVNCVMRDVAVVRA